MTTCAAATDAVAVKFPVAAAVVLIASKTASEVSAPVVVNASARYRHVVEGAVVASVAPDAVVGAVTAANADHAAS